MSPIRVFQIVNSLAHVGGAETVAVDLARLASSRWEPHLIALRSGPGGIAPALGAVLNDAGVPVHQIAMNGLRNISAARALRRLLANLRPAVIHAHNRPADVWTMIHGALARVPARVYTRHLTYPDLNAGMRRRYFLSSHLAHRVVAVSSTVAGHLVREERCLPRRITTIPNGVDFNRFDPASVDLRGRARALRESWGISAEAPVVGTLGRLTHQKGMDLFLHAAAGVASRVPAARFVVAGDGPARVALERLSASLGLKHRVVFAGFQEPAAAMTAFDVFLATSRYEGLPLTLLEAMACGKAVVAPRVGAFPEVVDSGVSGLLPSPMFWAPRVEGLDPTPFAEAVLQLLLDDDLRKRLGEEARKKVELNHGIQTMVARHEALYEQLLGNGGRP